MGEQAGRRAALSATRLRYSAAVFVATKPSV
jgi:hypothetical protein